MKFGKWHKEVNDQNKKKKKKKKEKRKSVLKNRQENNLKGDI